MKKENKKVVKKDVKKSPKKSVKKDAAQNNIKQKRDFKTILLDFLKHNYVYIIMITLVLIRVGLGYAIGAWYGTDQICDDLAMFNGISLKRLASPDELSLIKDLSYSLFLGFSAITNLPYTVVLSLFWALTAFVAWLAVRKVTKNKWVQFFAFSYVLFLPVAFEAWGGLRVYRNSIIVPCIITTFSLALIMLIDIVKKEKLKKTIWASILTGLSFAFTCFLQEDGIWLKACMLVVLMACVIVIGYRLFKNKIKGKFGIKKAIIGILVCLIPFGVLFVWEIVYKGFNYAFFGVYQTNTRTEGELAEYVEKTYLVDSPNRNKVTWSPYDAIAATFEASPTLKTYPQLLERLRTSDWSLGDMEKNPLIREFLGWAIRTELKNVGLWTSEKDVSDMFKRVNDELDEAFANGTLKKSEGRIQILKSAGAYTWDEIFDGQFVDEFFTSYRDAIWLEGYNIGFSNRPDVPNSSYARDNKVLHMWNDVNIASGKKREIANLVANIVTWIYRVVNIALFILTTAFVIIQVVKLFKNWKEKTTYIKSNALVLSLALTSFLFLGASAVYSLGMSWFFTSDFHRQIFIFYRVGMTALLTLAYIPAVIGVERIFIEQREKKKDKKERK